MSQSITTNQLKEVIADKLDLRTDSEAKAAVTFFNSCVDFMSARGITSEEMMKNSNNIITIVTGCLALLRDISDNPDSVMKRYEEFAQNNLKNGNKGV